MWTSVYTYICTYMYLDRHSSAVEGKWEEASLALQTLVAHSKLRREEWGGF